MKGMMKDKKGMGTMPAAKMAAKKAAMKKAKKAKK